MILRRSAPTPPTLPTTPASTAHAEHVAMAAFAAEVRLNGAVALVNAALGAEADRPADLRNRELIDLCLDLYSALAPTPERHVPVISGRPQS